jgi:hypothetical protein
MDNRFGDFRLPATDQMIGPEARIFRHAVEQDTADSWQSAELDDSTWERVTYDFGPQFWVLGPMPDTAPGHDLDKQLASISRVNPAEPVVIANRSYRWRPYSFSWRQGFEGDPGHQGYHGLKENVSDHFLCLGKRENALNEFKYVTEEQGGRYYLWTTATVNAPMTARIVASSQQDGTSPHASEVLTPATVFVNGKQVDDLRQPIPLRGGPNPVLVRYDHAGRGYFVLRRDETSSATSSRTPLSMTWFDDPAVIRYDVHAGHQPAEWFRFIAPPGLRAMQLTVRGNVEAWANGQPMRETGQGRFEAASPLPDAARVALRVRPDIGFCGAAVFPEPIRLDCEAGLTALGDWSKMGALECYSGGAWYRKSVTLTPQQTGGNITLNLGQVVATAEVRVNGHLAGIRVAPPWTVDITPLVQAGENRLEILVFNTLANHYTTIPTRYRGEPTSGLIGPVTLEIESASRLVTEIAP